MFESISQAIEETRMESISLDLIQLSMALSSFEKRLKASTYLSLIARQSQTALAVAKVENFSEIFSNYFCGGNSLFVFDIVVIAVSCSIPGSVQVIDSEGFKVTMEFQDETLPLSLPLYLPSDTLNDAKSAKVVLHAISVISSYNNSIK
jgi:hypothetical protein